MDGASETGTWALTESGAKQRIAAKMEIATISALLACAAVLVIKGVARFIDSRQAEKYRRLREQRRMRSIGSLPPLD